MHYFKRKLSPIVITTTILTIFPLLLTGQLPTAQLTGPANICKGDSVQLTVDFTGTPPFDISYNLFNFQGVETTFDISGINSDPYQFYVSEPGNYTLTEVNNANGTGTASGVVTLNAYPVATTASISGGKTKCPYDSVQAEVKLTGTAPWSVTFGNGSFTSNKSGITSTTTLINLLNPGTYQLLEVTDANCKGSVSGSFVVQNYSLPNVSLFGNDSICEGELSPIYASFQGQTPFQLEYSKNNSDTIILSNISQTNYNFNVKGEGDYSFVKVSDAHCSQNLATTIEKKEYPSDNVEITGLNKAYSVFSGPVKISASPHGGIFTGNGMIASDSTFYPGIAGVDNSPHNIVYSYTNPNNGCVTRDTAVVAVITANAFIEFPEGDKHFCFYEDSVYIEAVNLNDVIGSFTIPEKPQGIIDLGNNRAVILPSVLQSGMFDVVYTYVDGDVLNVSEKISVEFIPKPEFTVVGGKKVYCSGDGRKEINGNHALGKFTGDGVIIENNIFYFVPNLAKIGDNLITYEVKTEEGCQVDTTDIFHVNPLPNLSFYLTDTCVSEEAPYAVNFINQTVSQDTIIAWKWLVSDGTLISTQREPGYTFTKSGLQNITLIAETNHTCIDTLRKQVLLKKAPVAEFALESICLRSNQAISLYDSSKSASAIETYYWRISNDQGQVIVNSSEKIQQVVFPTSGSYKVLHAVRDSLNCRDTIVQDILLRPTYVIADTSYINSFEDQGFKWVSKSSTSQNSWSLGEVPPQFTILEDNKAWYTSFASSKTENSWVETPCFDFKGVQRPMIEFDLWRHFDGQRDGGVLQYSLDQGKNWFVLGSINDGIQWFNSFQILGRPANQPLGWAAIKDNGWVNARHDLNAVKNKEDVIFRFVYGSDGTALNNHGFSFDNVKIKERSRLALIESFINPGDAQGVSFEAQIVDINQTIKDVVPIWYYTGAPESNAYYNFNPAPPNARQLFYSTSTQPVTIVNGTNTLQAINDKTENQLKSIVLTDASIELDIDKVSSSSNISIQIKITALKEVLLQGKSLYLVLAEQVSSLLSEKEILAVRYMLPDAAGTSLSGTLAAKEEITFDFSKSTDGKVDANKLKVVAFVQDDISKQVIQAGVDSSFIFPTNIPEKELIVTENETISLYPNPFEGQITIKRNNIWSINRLEVYNQLGQLMHVENHLNDIGKEHLINLHSLDSGIYLLKFMGTTADGKSISGQLKIIKVK